MRTVATTAVCDARAVAAPIPLRTATIARLVDYLVLT